MFVAIFKSRDDLLEEPHSIRLAHLDPSVTVSATWAGDSRPRLTPPLPSVTMYVNSSSPAYSITMMTSVGVVMTSYLESESQCRTRDKNWQPVPR